MPKVVRAERRRLVLSAWQVREKRVVGWRAMRGEEDRKVRI